MKPAYVKSPPIKIWNKKILQRHENLSVQDVCGLVNEALKNTTLTAILKDDYAKFLCCFFLKHKSEAKEILEGFIFKNLSYNIKYTQGQRQKNFTSSSDYPEEVRNFSEDNRSINRRIKLAALNLRTKQL